jgi:hypothetical protein
LALFAGGKEAEAFGVEFVVQPGDKGEGFGGKNAVAIG